MRLAYAAGFFSILLRLSVLDASGQANESKAQKLKAIRDANLSQGGVIRDPRHADGECGPSRPCLDGLQCFSITFRYQDGSPAYVTSRCENERCMPDFINLMIDGHADKTSQELIGSLRESSGHDVNIELACPAVNIWDPHSPNYGRTHR